MILKVVRVVDIPGGLRESVPPYVSIRGSHVFDRELILFLESVEPTSEDVFASALRG